MNLPMKQWIVSRRKTMNKIKSLATVERVMLLIIMGLIAFFSIVAIQKNPSTKELDKLKIENKSAMIENDRLKKEVSGLKSEINNEDVEIQYEKIKDKEYKITIVDKRSGLLFYNEDVGIAFQKMNLRSSNGKATVLGSNELEDSK